MLPPRTRSLAEAPAARPPAAAAPATPTKPDPNAVIATIGGQPVTEADLEIATQNLDQQFAQLPPEQKRAAALSAIIEIRLMAAEATAKGLDKDPEFQRQFAFLNQRALHSQVISKEIADKITEADIRAAYDKEIAESRRPTRCVRGISW